MLFDLSNPYDLIEFTTKCGELAEAQAVVELTRKRTTRSLSQNAYLHLLINYFAAKKGYTADEVKVDIFKRICNPDIFTREDKHLRSSASLTTAEMSTAIERFRNYSASQADLYLPDPAEQHLIIHAQRLIEKNRNYL